MILHVRLVLLGEEINEVGTCEISIASSTSNTDIAILGLTCSPSGVVSFIGVSLMLIHMARWYSCYRLPWNMGDISTRIPEFEPCLDPYF